jgi:hypothetical protein
MISVPRFLQAVQIVTFNSEWFCSVEGSEISPQGNPHTASENTLMEPCVSHSDLELLRFS